MTPAASPFVLVADPTLRRHAGHPYHASRGAVAAARRAGLDAVVLGARISDARLVQDLPFTKCFPQPLYWRSDWSFAAYERGAELNRAAIAEALGGDAASTAAIVAPTSDQTLLRAIAALIEDGVLPRSVAVLAWLLFLPRWNAGPDDAAHDAQFAEYEDAVARLVAAAGRPGAVQLCCETRHLRDRYAPLGAGGAVLHLAPVPSLAPSLAEEMAGFAARSGAHAPAVHFVAAGHATRAKGYELLPDALRMVLMRSDAVSFTIHGVAEGAGNPAAVETLERLQRLGSRVRVLTENLDSDAYYRLIGSADMLLLPYSLPEYRERGSGIFNESVRYGIPVIAPEGSDFAQAAIGDGRAVPLRAHSAEALAAAIGTAIGALPALKARCRSHLQQQAGQAGGDILGDFLRGVAAGNAA